MAQVLGALSLATDLGAGQPMGHVIRACYLSMCVAQEMGLSPKEQGELYYMCLLSHSGCTAATDELAALFGGDEVAAQHFLLRYPTLPEMLRWMARNAAPDAPPYARAWRMVKIMGQGEKALEEGTRGVCEVAARVAERLGMPAEVQTGLRYLFESWNGSGTRHIEGGAIPLHSRIAQAASAFVIFHGEQGPAAAEAAARRRGGKSLDPQVTRAFLAVARRPGFWEEMGRENLWDTVLAMEPEVPYKYVDDSKLDDIVLAFADFADLKLTRSFNHARNVGSLAEGIARRLKLSPTEVTTVRRAALLHDLGLVAIPLPVLDKPRDRLGTAEREKLLLHPYHAERILAQVPALQGVAELAGAHHERMDGSGYYRRLSGRQIPIGARIIAVVDRFDEATQGGADEVPLSPEDAVEHIRREVGAGLDADCFDALLQELGAPRPPQSLRREWPAGLTDREVEVLRLVAQGLTKRQIGERLFISEKTAGTHVEHVYSKAGVSSRAAAVLFAMEHGLLQ
jgi:HD-GYP domain-containing protein (c-di-GMP phosphodiesterase class II)